MGFQKEVSSSQALGSAGQISKAFHSYCNTISAVADSDDVCVGCFAQIVSSNNTRLLVKGASGVEITGKVAGVVVKDKYIDTCGTEAKHIYRRGDNVTILSAGSIFIEVESQATIGQYVHLVKTSGALSFDDAIDTSGDKVYTGFVVSKGNDAPYEDDGLIEITTALV